MWFSYGEGQQLFNFSIWAAWQVIKAGFKLLVYSPFIICGWAVANLILNKQDDVLLWVVFIFLFGFAFFKGILFLRKLIYLLISRRNLFWIPVWLFCTGFTTILPVWIVFGPTEKLVEKLSQGYHVQLLTWLISLAYGYFIYSRYQFLKRK